jgi:hypothetical protein
VKAALKELHIGKDTLVERDWEILATAVNLDDAGRERRRLQRLEWGWRLRNLVRYLWKEDRARGVGSSGVERLGSDLSCKTSCHDDK